MYCATAIPIEIADGRVKISRERAIQEPITGNFRTKQFGNPNYSSDFWIHREDRTLFTFKGSGHANKKGGFDPQMSENRIEIGSEK